jgi:hypothetical protein
MMMGALMTNRTSTNEPALTTTLYRHQKREQWGLAILAWEHEGKRGYQFEDGTLRVFKRGFYHLMLEVDQPADVTQRVLARLNRTVGRQEAGKKRNLDRLISFDDQLAIFRVQYPEGFSGKKWQGTMRGVDAAQTLKRHREPAIRAARELLDDQNLRRMIEAGQLDGIVQGLVKLLRQTNLVRPNQLGPLEIPPHRQERFALALHDLLHGGGPLRDRFARWVQELGHCGWELATAPAALLHPDEHVCVQPGSFRDQAVWMAPRLEHSSEPNAETYLRYLAMATAVQAKLEEEGLHPADLLDVHDFIWTTLRPAARKLLESPETESAAA